MRIWIVVGLAVVLILGTLAGCRSSSPPLLQTTVPDSPLPAVSSLPSPVPFTSLPQVAADKGGIVGVILDENGFPFNEPVYVFLASFYRHETDDWGMFLLDPSLAPSAALSESGTFQIVDIEPGEYVVVVGVTPQAATPVLGDDGQAQVFQINSGQVVNIGIHRVRLSE